jgi:hypothetical protein
MLSFFLILAIWLLQKTVLGKGRNFFQMLSFFFTQGGRSGKNKELTKHHPHHHLQKKKYSEPISASFLLSFFSANRLQEELSSFFYAT